MKPLVGMLALLLAISAPMAGAQESPLSRVNFAGYKATALASCDNSTIYGAGVDSPSWQDANPLRDKSNPYRPIAEAGAINEYSKYLDLIKGDQSCLSESPTGVPELDLAKCVYRETQNALFACYSIASMLRIAQEVETRFADNGRAKEALEKKIEALKKAGSESECNASINGMPGTTIKEGLLKNSSVQMCRYSHYLDYLYANAEGNVQVFIGRKTATGALQVSDTEAAARMLGGIMGAISSETSRTRDVHRTAIGVFMDMERTYGLHLMLTLIYEDFVEIRERLRALLNPIGQFIYKASNAQSPYNQ